VPISLAAPDIIQALIAGRLPRGIGITRLADFPPSWVKQRKMRGISIGLCAVPNTLLSVWLGMEGC
jgi:hypothetical protein